MKVCSRCHKTLPDCDFQKNGMVYLQCNSCREKRKKYRENCRKSSSLIKQINKVIPKKKSKVSNEKSIDFFVQSIIQKQVVLTFCSLCLENTFVPFYILIQVTGNFNPFTILLKNNPETMKISDFVISHCKSLSSFSEQCINALKKESNKDYILLNDKNVVEKTFDSLKFLKYLTTEFKNPDKSNDFMKIIEFLIGSLIYSKEDKELLTYLNFEEKIFEFENIPEED